MSVQATPHPYAVLYCDRCAEMAESGEFGIKPEKIDGRLVLDLTAFGAELREAGWATGGESLGGPILCMSCLTGDPP